jgi:hypothetical protein
VPGGVQGPAGTIVPGTYLESANNLSDVANAATARGFLGLGTIATQGAGAVAITGGSITGITDLAVADGGTGASTAAGARTNLSAQELDALLTAIAALVTVADRFIYTTGVDTVALGTVTTFARSLLDDATEAAARSTLGVLAGYGLLGTKTSVDMNVAGDNTITMPSGRYIIDKIVVDNASISLTTATGGVFTAVGGGGVTLAADQVLTALTASTKFVDLTLQAVVGTDTRTEGTLYFRVGTPQGAAATADFFIYGWKLL